MYRYSAKKIHELFINGKISAKEIAKYFLSRISQFNPKIQAFISVYPERILETADVLDKKREQKKPLGRLAGVPIALKDNIHLKGETTSCASKMLENFKAPFSATAAENLLKEDALIIGKTNMDEFAMGSTNEHSAFFPTHNPWNLDCVPGGSSGGSAAAVASRLVPIALGSDTGGSIRQPAALCSVTGFKPTYGRVSRYGLVAFGSSLDQIGPFAVNSEDIGMIMEVLAKHCPKDATSLTLPPETYLENIPKDFKNIKIGVPWHFLENLQPEIKKNFEDSINYMKNGGAEIIDIDLDILNYSISIYYILATAEASTNLARFDGIRYGYRSPHATNLNEVYDLSREEALGTEVKKRIMLGTYMLSSGFKEAYYKKAQKVRTLIIDAFDKAFSICNFVAMPVTPSTTFKIGSIQDPLQEYLQDLFTISANLAGLPAISIPSGFDNEKKPIGLQLLGPQLHDVSIIRYACCFENLTAFSNKIPPLFDKESSHE